MLKFDINIPQYRILYYFYISNYLIIFLNLIQFIVMKKLYVLFAFLCVASMADAQNYVTFRVCLKGRQISPAGVHIAGGAFTPAWTPGSSAMLMTRIGPAADSIFSITLPVAGAVGDTIAYKFVNADAWSQPGDFQDETGVTVPCTKPNSGDRILKIGASTQAAPQVTPIYRYNTCTTFLAATNELTSVADVRMSPNPVTSTTIMTFDNLTNETHSLDIVSITGQVVLKVGQSSGNSFKIDASNLAAGMYFARLSNAAGQSLSQKLVVSK
jgi:hypothetical protein